MAGKVEYLGAWNYMLLMCRVLVGGKNLQSSYHRGSIGHSLLSLTESNELYAEVVETTLQATSFISLSFREWFSYHLLWPLFLLHCPYALFVDRKISKLTFGSFEAKYILAITHFVKRLQDPVHRARILVGCVCEF